MTHVCISTLIPLINFCSVIISNHIFFNWIDELLIYIMAKCTALSVGYIWISWNLIYSSYLCAKLIEHLYNFWVLITYLPTFLRSATPPWINASPWINGLLWVILASLYSKKYLDQNKPNPLPPWQGCLVNMCPLRLFGKLLTVFFYFLKYQHPLPLPVCIRTNY